LFNILSFSYKSVGIRIMKKVLSLILFFLAYYNLGYARQSTTVNSIGTYTVTGNTNYEPSIKPLFAIASSLPVPATATSNSPLCVGDVLNLSTPTIPGATYLWSGPNSFSSSLQNPSINNVTPTAAGTYSVTVYLSGVTNVASTIVTINALPIPTITANYCAFAGKIQFTAGGGGTYLWNTSETTSIILIDIAGTYSVNVTNGAGCSAAASLLAATELVTDGSFTDFNAASPSFTTAYGQNQAIYTGGSTGLLPEGLYAVNTSAYAYHPNFHGKDHTGNTVGNRNFMMVNGSGSPITVWQQIINVIPNTDYYFSAWGMNLNPSSPAKLQFEINGMTMGTIADLNSAPKPTSEASVNENNWIRFYSNPVWNSGSVTTATIRIINLNIIANGNDFGIDDISFGTLAPIPYTIAPTVNGASTVTVCQGQIINLATNKTGGRAPITYKWTGPNSFTSTLQNPILPGVSAAAAGIYQVIVTDGYGCTPVTGTVSVTVIPLPVATISYSGNPFCAIGTATMIQTGQGGGTYSSTAGLNLNPSTGDINLASSTPGTYLITYSFTNNSCPNTTTTSVIINALPLPPLPITGVDNVCVGTTITLSDVISGGTWNSSNAGVATVNGSGIVTGVSSGTSVISYTVINLNGCITTVTYLITVNPLPVVATITGLNNICAGVTTTLSDAIVGGIWSSSNAGVSTIDGSGIVTGIVAGTSTISYTVTNINGCTTIVNYPITVNALPVVSAITGNNNICIGTTTNLSDATPGGIWSSNNTGVATVDINGKVTGIAAGTATFSYVVTNLNVCTTTVSYLFTVNALPVVAAITGLNNICLGANTVLSDVTPGGIWSSSNSGIATITSGGMVTGVSAGVVTVSYIVANLNGCTTTVTYLLTINALPVVASITGLNNICAGTSTTLSDGTPGGIWSSSNTGIATITSGGMVTGVSAGVVTVSYVVTNLNGCTTSVSYLLTVNALPVVAAITGLNNICDGNSTKLSDATPGGSWSSSNTGIASITSDGIVSGIIAGAVTITYAVTNLNGCPTLVSYLVTVNPLPVVAAITGISNICAGTTTTLSDAIPGGIWSSSNTGIATVDGSGKVIGVSVGSVTISYTLTNTSLCTTIVTYPITINGLPVASFNSSLTQICQNSLLLLDGTIIKLNKYINTSQYQWYINDALIGMTSYFPGYTIDKKDDVITIKLKAISSFGCSSDSISKLINVIHPPKPSFSLSDTIGCGPLSISFNNTTIGSAYQYDWNLGNGSSSNVVQPATITYNFAASGSDTTYTISLTAYSQCDTVTISRKIVVKRKAKVDFSATPTIGCSPIKVLFTNNSIGENATYKLWFGDGTDTLLTTASISHNYYTGVNTIYNAKLIAINTCGSDSVSIPIVGSPNTIKSAIYVKDSILCGFPNTVTFYNSTTGANQFSWDFGDNTSMTTSKAVGPISHLYIQKGSYTVKILISNGCSDTIMQRNIYVFSIPKVDFTAVPQSICKGDSIHFNALTDIGSSFIWRFGNGSGSVLNNPVYSYKNSGIYTVLLKVANANNTCYDSITKLIEVVANRQGYMQASDSVIRCVPFSETFFNRSTPSVNTQWNFGDGSFAKGDTVTHIFASNGNYQVTMLSVSPGGCKFADTNNIRVASPVGSLVYNTNISCTKGPIKFESITTNADSIRWDFGDGTTLTSKADNSPVYHTYPQAGIYLPKARIIGSADCSVVKDRGDTIKIEQVVAAYKLAVIYDCGKTTFNFMDSSHSFLGINNWNWNIGPSSFLNQKNITQVYSQAGVYPVVLIVTGNTGCKDTVKSNLQVAIYQYPKVNIHGIAAVCKESLINLKSQVISIDSIKSLLWDLGNGYTSKDSSVQILYNASGSYQVKLTVSTINKCYDSVYKQLTIYAAPNITLNRINTICRGSSIDLLASGALNYIWKDQNDSILCNGCNSINVTPLNNVKYKIIGYNQYGCSKIDSASINVIQPFSLTVSPGDSICIGSEKKLSAYGASIYSWYPENTLNNCISATVYASPLVTTTYRVIGKDKNNCFADTSHVTVIVGNPTPLDIGRDTILQSGSTYTFNPVLPSTDIIKWSWSGLTNSSCNDCPNPQARVVYDVCISCTVTNTYNCQTSDTLCIKTFCPEAEVFVPNAFTPDGDGINDKLMVQGKGIKQVKSFRIFNRWGEMVFERTNFSPGDPAYAWDGKIRGKAASPDVFVYICEATCEKGYSSIFKGNVAILK